MTRFLENGLAALAAITLFAITFSAVVIIPTGPTLAAIAAPIAA